MQSAALYSQAQPFIRLAQANMELLTRFSTSPEVTAQATQNAGHLFQQASGSAMKLVGSGAFAQLVQGMMTNYMEFLAEFGQGSMAMLAAGQSQLSRQAQELTETVAESTSGRSRSSR